jgi:hypothetical protein
MDLRLLFLEFNMLTRIFTLLWMLTIFAQPSFAAPFQVEEVAFGKIKDAALEKLAPKTGYIADEATWKKLWAGWRPGEEMPEIDFAKELLLVGTVPGPNSVFMKPTLEEGDVKFIVGGTKIGGPGFGYRILKVNRDGVKSVNGNAVGENDGDESITVKVVGTLQTGIIAIGGETTGATITAQGITWELDFGNSPLRKTADTLDGKKAVVQGRLERRKGVEIRERWIVTVTDLKAAD